MDALKLPSFQATNLAKGTHLRDNRAAYSFDHSVFGRFGRDRAGACRRPAIRSEARTSGRSPRIDTLAA